MERSIKVTPMDCFGTYMFRIDGWGPRSVRNHCIEWLSESEMLDELGNTEADDWVSGSGYFDAQDSAPVTSEDIRWLTGLHVNDLEAGELLDTVLNGLYRNGYQATMAIDYDDNGETVYLRHDYFDDETIAQGDEGKWATVVCNAIGQYFHEAGDVLTVDRTQTMVSVACAMDPVQFNV